METEGEMKEELLFEGMIELNLQKQQTAIQEENCDHPAIVFESNMSTVEPNGCEKPSCVIDNKVAVRKPDLFVPNLVVPLLRNVSGINSKPSNIDSFYLKVTEDEIFEGYFPLPSDFELLFNDLDERINNEAGDSISSRELSSKTKHGLKRKLNGYEGQKQYKTVKLDTIKCKNKANNPIGSNGILEKNKEGKSETGKISTAANNKSSVDNNKSNVICDRSQSKELERESKANSTPKILVPKVPKSGDEWYDLSGGWKKRCMQRKSGSSTGTWDVYLYPPGDVKRLRSSTELMRFVKDHPEMSIDPLEVNMDLPFKVSPDGKPSLATQKLITAIKEIKERGSISEKLFGATAAEKISAAEPLSLHLCKTKKQENIYAKAYHSESYSNSNHPEPIIERASLAKHDNNPYKKTYLSQSYMKRNRFAPVVFAKPKPVDHQRPHTRPKIFHSKRPTMGQLFILERLFASSICMPTPQKVTEWAAKLDLNRIEVMQWFRVKWRSKLLYEAEIEEIRDQLDAIDPDKNLSPDTLNACRQKLKFDLKKAYDMVLDPTSEIDLITEGDFVIDFETEEDDDKSRSGDEDNYAFDESSGDENIEIEYHEIKSTEE